MSTKCGTFEYSYLIVIALYHYHTNYNQSSHTGIQLKHTFKGLRLVSKMLCACHHEFYPPSNPSCVVLHTLGISKVPLQVHRLCSWISWLFLTRFPQTQAFTLKGKLKALATQLDISELFTCLIISHGQFYKPLRNFMCQVYTRILTIQYFMLCICISNGPYANNILTPQGSTGSSLQFFFFFFVSNESPYFSHYEFQNFNFNFIILKNSRKYIMCF